MLFTSNGANTGLAAGTALLYGRGEWFPTGFTCPDLYSDGSYVERPNGTATALQVDTGCADAGERKGVVFTGELTGLLEGEFEFAVRYYNHSAQPSRFVIGAEQLSQRITIAR